MHNFKLGDIVTIKKDFPYDYGIPDAIINSLIGEPCKIISMRTCNCFLHNGDGWYWDYDMLEPYIHRVIGKQYR